MDKEKIISALPHIAPPGLLSWALSAAEEELGGELCIYRRESLYVSAEIKQTMDAEDWEAYHRKSGHHWGAVCSCTACGEDWEAGWLDKGILVAVGDDGSIYDGWADKREPLVQRFDDGDETYCPICGSRVELVHASKLRSGRTYATQVGTVEVLNGGCMALMYWLVSRRVDEFGVWECDIRPREALVLDERGNLWRFSRTQYCEYGEAPAESWVHRNFTDPEQLPFYSYGNGPARSTVGCWWYGKVTDLTGTSGEKTAVDDYIRKGEDHPAVYLRLWREHPSVENLVRQGWGGFVAESIRDAVETARMYRVRALSTQIDGIEWAARKPHAMLNMSREDFRRIKSRPWRLRALQYWLDYSRTAENPVGAEEFARCCEELGVEGVGLVTGLELDGEKESELRKVTAYLRKQTDIPDRDKARIFADYRQMLERRGGEPERVEYWPPHLRAAHDGLAASIQLEKDEKSAEAFRREKERYAALEWSDGELCIVVPGSNAELVAEGATLHHCVGRYGETHLSGQPIFFVRKYRTKTRSYFTLNENLQGSKPRRVQLHGYGNEWANGKRLRIPEKVEAFVRRWEEEVLAPWFAEQAANKKTGKKGRKAA